MSYQSKHGITEITSGTIDNLSISVDSDYKDSPKYPVLLYTPDMGNKIEHHHIVLTRENAADLLIWLQHYLQDTTV